jgi:hypothetical protein
MLAYDPATNPLNNNEWSFPLLEIIHIASFAVSIGTIFIVDLRCWISVCSVSPPRNSSKTPRRGR